MWSGAPEARTTTKGGSGALTMRIVREEYDININIKSWLR